MTSPARPAPALRRDTWTRGHTLATVVIAIAVALVGWIVSIFLIPASVLLHSPAATAVAIVLTWLAIHNFRRVDAGERRAQAAADAQPDPDPGPDAPAVR